MYNRTKLGTTAQLAYILIYFLPFIGSFLFLISDGKDRDIRYNCIMSLYLSLAETAVIILFTLMGKIPYIGWLFTFVLWIVSIFYAGAMLLSLARALNGKELKIPFFYHLVKKTM